MKNQSKKGMALFIVFVTLIILVIIVFSFHKYARYQLIKGHHEELTRIADNVAVAGIKFSLSAIHNEKAFRSLFFEDKTVQALLSSKNPSKKYLIAKNGKFFKRITEVFQNSCVDSIDVFPGIACEEISAEISKVSFMSRTGALPSLKTGRDYHEKKGKIKLTCVVAIGGIIKRKAEITRDFKLFSFIPGPYSRFNLFVHSSSQRNSSWKGSNPYFNVVKSNINGKYLNDYKRLILINNPDTETSINKNSAEILKKSGWLYLGNDPNQSKDTHVLNIPAGYHSGITVNSPDPFQEYPDKIKSGIGAGFYLAKPAASSNDAASYRLKNLNLRNGLQPIIKTFGIFWGANGYGCWGEPDYFSGEAKKLGADKCLSSWLLPFGTQHFPSPTLIVGPVLAGYLSSVVISKPGQNFDTRFYFNSYDVKKYIRNNNFALMTRSFTGDMNKGKNDLAYFVSQTPLTKFNNSLGITNGTMLTMGDVIDENDQTGIKALMWSFANYPAQPFPYIPFNFLFEVVHGKYQNLDFFKLQSDATDSLRSVNDRSAIPGNSIWAPPEAQPSSYAYFQSAEALPVWLYSATNPQIGDKSEEVFFEASLKKCNFDNIKFRDALLQRVTKTIRLPAKKSLLAAGVNASQIQKKYQEILIEEGVFVEKNNNLEFHSPGIFRIKVGGTPTLEYLDFESNIITGCGGILIVENAELSLKGITPLSESKTNLNQADHAFSIICLDSIIKVNSYSNSKAAYPLNAYLVSLSKQNSGTIKKEAGNGLYLDGGLAIASIDGLFKDYKKDGGIIRYNPIFNPVQRVKNNQRYGFRIMMEGESGFEIKGAN
ncbi:MAG: hypothetical protein ACQETH_05185 [Candidatus Rifleibacteriota bacterium]